MKTTLRSCSAYTLLLVLLTLLSVSGPHRVHHLPDVAPHDHDHATHEHETPAPTPVDCPVLFFVQHNTAVTTLLAWVPLLLPAPEIPVIPHTPWAAARCSTPLLARAPPCLA